ncbi:hypothetical protein IMZ48_16865, partial [Candidatus Bathyarchaeota archaeon]|nr:hypothetical protein [Candidatus Bathyarchaeota archaeon]
MKQTKLRRKRVFRYAVLYFFLVIIFLGLLIAPAVVGPKLPDGIFPAVLDDFALVQPTGQDNNNTLKEGEAKPEGEDDAGGGDDGGGDDGGGDD